MDRSNLDDSNVEEKVALITIGDVFDEVYRLADNNLEIGAELTDILENILGERISDAKRARNLLNLKRQNYDDDWLETEISKIADGEKFETRSLNKEDLQHLLNELERAEVLRTDRQETASSLAKKYGVSENQVKELLDRVEQLQRQATEQGLVDEKLARNIAEKAVIREEQMEAKFKKHGLSANEANRIAGEVIDKNFDQIIKMDGKTVKVDVKKLEVQAKSEQIKIIGDIANKQVERFAIETKVEKIVRISTDSFTKGLKDGLKISQPGFEYERHAKRIEEIGEGSMRAVAEGKYDNLISSEVQEKDILVDVSKALKDVIGVDETTVDLEVKQASEEMRHRIQANSKLIAKARFIETTEGIQEEIVRLNPNIKDSVVEKYADIVTTATYPIEAAGEEMARSISGEYGLNKDAYSKTNLLMRVVIGSADSSELTTNIKSFENQGVDIKSQVLSPEGRAVSSFLGDIKNNPLLSGGMGAIKKQLMGKFFSSQVVVEGVGGFLTKSGFSTVFGVETATLVPTLFGFFAEGGTIGSAITGIAEAGSVSAWTKGILTAGKVAGAVGKTAAVAGGTAATAGGTAVVVGGTTTTASGPIGWIIGGVILVGTAIVKIGKKVTTFLKDKLGIDLKKLGLGAKVKKFFRDDLNLGKFGEILATPIIMGGVLLLLVPFLALRAGYSFISKVVPIVVVCLILWMLYKQFFKRNPYLSSLVPNPNMIGAGTDDYYGGGEYDPDGPPLIAPDIIGAECSLAGKTAGPVRQCDPAWNSEGQTLGGSGCTMCQMGCGIAAVSTISMRINNTLNPNYWMENSTYASASCGGTSLTQAISALRSLDTFINDDVRSDSCSPTSIARSICEGNKLVIIVADFYQNSEATRVGGHFVTAVGVKNGEIVVLDPIYDEDGPVDGYSTPFLRSGDVPHLGAIHSIKGCAVVNSDKIN